MSKATWGGVSVFGLLFHITVIEEIQGRNSNRAEACWGGADGEAMRIVAYWLAQLFSCSGGLVPPEMDWTFPYQSLIKKITYRFACSPILYRQFFFSIEDHPPFQWLLLVLN